MTPPSQNQQNSAFQLQQTPETLGVRPANYGMNPSNSLSNEEFEEDESFLLNKKKLRVDSSNGYGAEAKPVGIQNEMQGQPMIMNPQYSQLINNGYEEKPLFNTSLLNNILLTNGNNNVGKVNEQRVNTLPLMQIGQPIYMPLLQNQMSQDNMQNISFIPVQQGFQQGFQPQVQNLTQNMKLKQPMDMNTFNYSPPNSVENVQKEKGFNIEEYMNQFQSKLSEVLISQNKMLIDLREKNDLVQDTLACFD